MTRSPRSFSLFILGLMLVSLSTVNVAKSAVNNTYAWRTFQGDAQRTGYTESPAPNSNQTFWKYQTGGPIICSPVTVAGIVFVSSTDGYLYAINATTGVKLWEFWIGADLNSPTVAHNKVFITSKSGTVSAYDMYTGSQVWNKSLGEEIGFGSPLIVGSRVFVNTNQTIVCLNEAVGVTLYSAPVPHANGIAPLAHSGDLVIAVALRGIAIGVNGNEVNDGNMRFWVTLAEDVSDQVKSAPTISGERIIVAVGGLDDNSMIFGLNNFGMRDWEQQLDGFTQASPAVAYNSIYLQTDNFIYALHENDGTIKWSRPIESEYSVSSPAVADGKVYVGIDNIIYAFDSSSGEQIWSYRTEGQIQSSPAISGGLLFVGSDDGILYAIGTHFIPEFPSWIILPLFLVTSLIIVLAKKKIGG